MQLTLQPNIPPLSTPIRYTDRVFLIGSCFTEHISGRLAQHKFHTLQNPHGILFNPLSVADSLESYLSGRTYTESDLFFLNETWNSWDHHSRFSHTDVPATLAAINDSQQAAHAFIGEADWVIITLGSAFQYFLKEHERAVANNHRAPAQWFEKRLLETDTITEALQAMLEELFRCNEQVQVLFTISPVRHIRDGVVDNNRSKARLIESVHALCAANERCHYFPAYELIIDILRDYRFYDVDFVHPNYLATEFVWEEFVKACIAPEDVPLMDTIKEIMTARHHRARFPDTEGHRKFLDRYAEKIRSLVQAHPYLDLGEELGYFTGSGAA